MSKKPTLPSKTPGRTRLGDIALACNVSISTVSRALTGQKGVRDDIRERILDAARRARYPLPNRIQGARIAVFASTAAMTDYRRTQFTWHVLEGLKAAATAKEIEISLVPLPDSDENHAPLRDVLDSQSILGALLLTIDDMQVMERIQESGKPAVLINGDDPLMRISSVSPCNRSASRMACDYLIGLGHQRIGFVMRPGRTTIRRRLEGWRDALAEHGLPCPDENVIDVEDWTPECAEQAIGERLDRGALDVTALLCAADSLALGALSALTARQIACPDEMSIMGMDDLPISDLLTPRLTTMHIPARELGETAVDMLVELATHGERVVRRTELACCLVERDSTAPPMREIASGGASADAGRRIRF
ncbi:LacI family transcriptional regulator [Microvirga terrae]|uniref:LacI family transcriptional regulator n=1 Tax=Microvirga terrae TaxID=2740529 RepID=A0ABY5RU33_9HYPH|nr:LacI family DNA-binding transcriptional regulator [Microvirga terrae]UVF20429.1 LacI family transcriptional regulator [Microvirga terrae]